MKVSPVATEQVVSQYTRQVNLQDKVHNVVVTHKDVGGNEKVDEVTKIYDRGGKLKEIGQSKIIDIQA